MGIGVGSSLAAFLAVMGSLIHPSLMTLKVGEGISGKEENGVAIENERIRLELFKGSEGGYERGRILLKEEKGAWRELGIIWPLGKAIIIGKDGKFEWIWRPMHARLFGSEGDNSGSIALEETSMDPEGVEWRIKLSYKLEKGSSEIWVEYRWETKEERRIERLWGINLYAGEPGREASKVMALFPGLEYLYDGEISSNPRDLAIPLNDRRSPHPMKVTIPLMAVSFGKGSSPPPANPSKFYCPDSIKDMTAISEDPVEEVTVSLLWDPMQKWDGVNPLPSPWFSSPSEDGISRHRMGLFIPTVSEDKGEKPYILNPSHPLSLKAVIHISQGPVTSAISKWFDLFSGGVPSPSEWPRSFEEELALCRDGFLKTVWDDKGEKWRHCIDWAPAHSPGFATLLWFDGHISRARESLERVYLVADRMMKEGGAGIFVSGANCHIMRWEFPFHYGYLAYAISALEREIEGILGSQEPDGSWRFRPGDEKRKELGEYGDGVLGTCAHPAYLLMRYARITGDERALKAGEKALNLMERFRVPRGAQGWECPIYEPDILAAAWAIGAYVEGYKATGNRRWLRNALYWAETGLPFLVCWEIPGRPGMKYATIPVFGSTFYTHSWLGVAVQWCGLVYAYNLQHLADLLETLESPPRLGTTLSASDWRRIAEGITVSGMIQQFTDEKRRGTYPDGFYNGFTYKAPPFINPEDIMVNVLAIKGMDPDIQTVRVGDGIGFSSGARILSWKCEGDTISLKLWYFRGERSHGLLFGLHNEPKKVLVNGIPLQRLEEAPKREPGWWFDARAKRLYITVPHHEEEAVLDVEL